MRVVFLIIFALVAVISATREESIKTAHEECQADKATYIDVELLKKIRDGEKVIAENVGAHFLCINRKRGTQIANGDIDEAKLRADVAEKITETAKVDEIVNACKVRPAGSTAENVAIGLMKCLHEHGFYKRN